MKANRLAWTLLLLLLLNTAAAQQSMNNLSHPDKKAGFNTSNPSAADVDDLSKRLTLVEPTSAAATNNSAPDEIRTLDGGIYKSVHVVKYEADGIVINYAPSSGGIGMTKIKFEKLPADLRRKYTRAMPSDVLSAIDRFNETKAIAEKGDMNAEVNLGHFYYTGYGVAKDEVEAVKWWHKAAEQGDATAQFNIGHCYAEGYGVAKDEVEAVKWWRKAAEQGNVKAEYLLGVFYRAGEGTRRNYEEAAKWHQKAAEQGLADAQIELGKLYSSGLGVPQNYQKAAEMFRMAAEQGNAAAQGVLGYCYWIGQGVPKDLTAAYKWFNLASAQGDKKANECLSIIEGEMTPEEITEAQQLTREFKPRKVVSGNFVSGKDVANSSRTASGTGFFITDDGYLVSNYHVVKDATKVRLLTSAGLIDAKVVSVDAANDLALLKADGKFSPLPISPSRSAQLGGTVATVGFPNIGMQGFAPKLAKGEIASLSGAQDDPRYFQISVPVQPGNSGGALVDEHGNVVGIVSAKLNASVALATSGALPENVNYAVKSSFLLSFLESVPDVANKLKAPVTVDRKFEDVVKSAQDAAVLVLVY